jgi:hypothetical protein
MTQSKAIKLLERLQERACKENIVGRVFIERIQSIVNDPTQDKYITENIDKDFSFMLPEERKKLKSWFFENWNVVSKNMPTRFEEPLTYAEIMELARDIEDDANRLCYPVPSRPVIGTLPAGCVNACALAIPSSNQHLIIIATGLFRFLYRISIIITQAMPVVGDERNGRRSVNPKLVEQNIEENPDIVERFYEAFYAYLVRGDMGITEPWDINKYTSYYAMGIREPMELFLMGHEYGHIINGHFSNSKRVASKIGTEKVDTLTPNHRQEYEADWTGMWLTLAAMNAKRYDLAWSCLGFSLFFSCYEFLENGLSILETGEMGNYQCDTHPPTLYRRSMLWNGLHKSPRVPRNKLDPAMRAAEKIHINMNQLWIRITSRLRKLHEDGEEPAEKWI